MPIDLPPVPAIEISVASRGYSKGVAQTDGPQVVVKPELSFGNLRLAGYGKNVTSDQFDAEVGASLGYSRQLGKTELAATATVKRLVDADPIVDKTALELNASLSHSLGVLKPKLSLSYTPDDLGATRRSFFWEAGASYKLDSKSTLQAGIGIRSRNGGPDYTSITAGGSRDVGAGFTAEARLYATSRSELGDYYRRRLVFSLRKRI